MSRNIETKENEIAAFKEISDEWYNKRLSGVLKNPKKFRDWMVIDNMLHKHTIEDLLDPIYNRDDVSKMAVQTEYREKVIWHGHNVPFSTI